MCAENIEDAWQNNPLMNYIPTLNSRGSTEESLRRNLHVARKHCIWNTLDLLILNEQGCIELRIANHFFISPVAAVLQTFHCSEIRVRKYIALISLIL